MAPVTVTRTFEVPGYASSNGVLFPEPLPHRSDVFSGGGYDWSIIYYPEVDDPDDGGPDTERIGLHVWLMTRGATVRASLDIALLDPTAVLEPWKLMDTWTRDLSSGDRSVKAFGMSIFKGGLNDAPGPGYLTRGGLLFHCTITVFKPQPPAPEKLPAAPSSSDMARQLGEIYETEDGWDVKFLVEGKEFSADKIILAMRSPVFKAELYGQMMDSTAHLIEIRTCGKGEDMMCDLLLAADRYGVEKLRILCEHELCKAHVQSVARMVVFADDRQCSTLKDACVEFFATSGSMDEVEASDGYVQLRSSRLLTLAEGHLPRPSLEACGYQGSIPGRLSSTPGALPTDLWPVPKANKFRRA
ncbi:hypothetical protein EJB05_08404, partial [Eragrostis curvula]